MRGTPLLREAGERGILRLRGGTSLERGESRGLYE